MIKMILISGLLFSHSLFAAEKGAGEKRLKKLLSCDAVMQAAPDSMLARAKTLLEKHELLSEITPDILKARMNMSSSTFFAELSSLVSQLLASPKPQDTARLSQILGELERAVDLTLAQEKPKFDSGGKARMETRRFEDPTSWYDYGDMIQEQPKVRPLNPVPAPAHPHYSSENRPGFRPDWPPREKP